MSRDVRSDGTRPRGLVRQDLDPASPGALFIGVVHAADGVRYSAVAGSRKELIQQLAEYARQRGDHALLPDHARHLRTLLVRRELEAAVELYFGLVGERWDEEWLVTAVLNPAEGGQIAAVVGEVALRDALGDRARLRDAS